MARDCGIRFKLPGGRQRVGPGVAKTETFRQMQVLRFDGDDRSMAREHIAGRNTAAWRVLGILSFMRNDNLVPAGTVVNWGPARVQAMSGDPLWGAAHNLPCQIVLNGHLPWDLVHGEQIDEAFVIGELRSCFGHVHWAPNALNEADLKAEANCLRGALVEACTYVIAHSKPLQRLGGVVKTGIGDDWGKHQLKTSDLINPGAGIDHGAVQVAYRSWISNSIAAYERAIADVAERGASVKGEDVTERVTYFLERYRDFTPKEVPLPGNLLDRLEQSIWRAG